MGITTPLFDINDVYTTKQLILTLYNMYPNLPNETIISKCLSESGKVGGLVRYSFLDTRERTAFEFSFDRKVDTKVFNKMGDIVISETIKCIKANNIVTFTDLYNKINVASKDQLYDLMHRAINCIETYTPNGSYFIYMLT